MDERVAKWPEKSLSAKHASPGVSPVDLSRESDLDLMARLQNGQQEALSPLFDRYHRLVVNISTKILRDRAEAEDVMQEVFLAIYQRADRFDAEKGSPKNWIIQFTYHKSLNRRKYLALRGALQDSHIEELESRDDCYSQRAESADDYSPEEMLSVVRQGLEDLTPKQREVVQLVCFEGLLLREIADRTKEPLGNVRHHYYRGIAKLREHVKGSFELQEKMRAARGGEQ